MRFGWLAVALTSAISCGGQPASKPAREAPIVAAPPASAEDDSQLVVPGAEPEALEPIALALVVDRSGSMSGLPLEMTLSALRAAVRELDPNDWVTIIAFDSQPTTVVEARKLEAPDALDAAIGRIAAGGGTDILPALALAGEALAKDDTPKSRHVILMSDGQAPSQNLDQIVGKVVAAGARVTTIALGHSTDQNHHARIAELGGGRFHHVTDPRALPDVFRREVALARNRREAGS